MKKILLLSSMLFIFLSACGSAETSIPATPISTLAPPATATVQPATATEAPTATATAKPIDWDTATDQQKLDAAPKIEGLIPNISPNPYHPTDIIYRDAVTGEAIKAVDLTTGNEISLQDAGIIKLPQNGTLDADTLKHFPTTDGLPLEAQYFGETEAGVKNGLNIIQNTTLWVEGGLLPSGKINFNKISERNMTWMGEASNNKNIWGKLFRVPGFGNLFINEQIFQVGDLFFIMNPYSDSQGKVIELYQKMNKDIEIAYFDVDAETFAQIIEKFQFTPPIPVSTP